MSDDINSKIISIVKCLHAIQLFPQDGELANFDHLLLAAVDEVCEMVNFTSEKPNDLELSSSPFESLSLIYYSPGSKKISNRGWPRDNIYLLIIKNDNNAETAYQALLEILSQSNNGRKDHLRLKESYTNVVSMFAALIQSLWLLYSASQDALVQYVLQCLLYEFNFFNYVDKKLPPLDASPQETQDLLAALDDLVDDSDLQPDEPIDDDVHDDDSIFSYDQDQDPILKRRDDGLQTLEFDSTDPVFLKLYHNLLQLALLKKDVLFDLQVHLYAKALIDLFKKQKEVHVFELNSYSLKEERLQILYDFFLGTEEQTGIVPQHLVDRASRMIDSLVLTADDFHASVSEFDPVENQDDVENVRPDSDPNALVVRGFQKEEFDQIMTNLTTVFSILNEYHLQFDPTFPKMFQNYITLVYEEMPDMATSDDFQFIELVVLLVGQIIDFEAGDNTSESKSIHEIVDKLYSTQASFSVNNTESSILMRLSLSEFTTRCQIQKTLIRRWNTRTLKVNHLQLLISSAPNFKKTSLTKFLNIWFDKSKKIKQLHTLATSYSNQKLLVKVLDGFWILKIVRLGQAEHKISHSLFTQKWNLWKSKTNSLSQLETKLIDFHDQNLTKKYFDIFGQRLANIQHKKTLSDQLRSNIDEKQSKLAKARYFLIWFTKLDQMDYNEGNLVQKLAELSYRERSYILQKHFNVWLLRHELANLYKELKSSHAQALKQRTLEMWKKNRNLGSLHERFVDAKSKQIKETVLRYWKEKQKHLLMALAFEKKQTTEKIMKLWVLRERSKKAQFDTGTLAAHFKKWKLKWRSSSPLAQRVDIRSDIFIQWKKRTKDLSDSKKTSIDFCDINLSKKSFDVWQKRVSQSHEQAQLGQLFVQKKYFDIMKKKFSDIENLQHRNAVSGSTFSERFGATFALRLWKKKYLTEFEKFSNQKALTFQTDVVDRGRCAVFLGAWRMKLLSIEKKERELVRRLSALVQGNPILGPYLSFWFEKTMKVREADETANDFFVSMQLKRFLLVWYEKYVTKASYLSEVAEDYLNRAEYGALIDYLRKWNLKYVKTIKRNEQTCEMFSQRWHQTRSKSIFELWLHKSKLKRGEASDGNETEYVEANTSLFSTNSPLAKKRGIGPRGNERRSYLYTPVKNQVSSLPFTPSSRTQKLSPTRLQETNQKMKIDRMDALINRYRSARPESYKSRPANPQTLASTMLTRLSPPRTKSNYSFLATKPPAPDFEQLRGNPGLPEATSSPVLMNFDSSIDDSAPNSPSQAAEPPASILDTARKLRQMRPLVVPPARTEDSFAMTPAAKLRERLSRASVDSNVFRN